MAWLADYWWLLVLLFPLGVMINVIKGLSRLDYKKYLANRQKPPEHGDCNDKWDDDD